MFGRFCYALIINSGDRRAESREFFDKLFISAFDVINLRNLRRALRDKSRQHHRRARAQIARPDDDEDGEEPVAEPGTTASEFAENL